RWVEGPDLRKVLAGGEPLDPARAVELLEQVAGGLDAAHAEGLIHRDIKPANVLLEADHAFLSDFGLARTTYGGDATTRVAGLVGTVDYLAPELVDGGTATIAADVYALGCVLFQMLTGSVPFPIDGLIANLHARTTTDPPAPTRLNPALPRGFDEVSRRALARDPEGRYASAGELAAAARRALGTAPRRPPRSPRSRRTRLLLATGGAICVALVATLVVVLTGGPGSARAHATGQALPAPGSLHPCGDLLTAPNGDCRGATGGVSVLASPGTTARMQTMDFKVTRVVQSHAILDPYSEDTVTAPPGQRFIVIECTIANRTRTAQVFEPDELEGRQTALFLYGAGGDRVAPRGPHFVDYSAQNLPAAGLIPLSLADRRFEPAEPGTFQFAGALAFSYPVADLDSAHSLLLYVHEFGQNLDDEGSVGVFRAAIVQSPRRAVYKSPEF
ncbi:MAG: serine/threonine protein kinase, partial [Actinobacteria bacterium]|nr:serine/threonine protein kinase [Actinomycetota bacterium]